MSTYDIAGDQIKCVRALSVILADGSLAMPRNWSIHCYPDFEWAAPRLEGFFHDNPTPPASVLRAQIHAYVDKFGLVVEEMPHGDTDLISVSAAGLWQGVELRVWGPARPEEGAR